MTFYKHIQEIEEAMMSTEGSLMNADPADKIVDAINRIDDVLDCYRQIDSERRLYISLWGQVPVELRMQIHADMEKQCTTCGDHDCDNPRACETGDGE